METTETSPANAALRRLVAALPAILAAPGGRHDELLRDLATVEAGFLGLAGKRVRVLRYGPFVRDPDGRVDREDGTTVAGIDLLDQEAAEQVIGFEGLVVADPSPLSGPTRVVRLEPSPFPACACWVNANELAVL